MERLPAALVCDKESPVRDLIRSALEERGIMTLGAENGAEAIRILGESEVGLLFVDLDSSTAPLPGLMARASALSAGHINHLLTAGYTPAAIPQKAEMPPTPSPNVRRTSDGVKQYLALIHRFSQVV